MDEERTGKRIEQVWFCSSLVLIAEFLELFSMTLPCGKRGFTHSSFASSCYISIRHAMDAVKGVRGA